MEMRRAGVGQKKRGRSRHKGQSIDPNRPNSQSSSSLSSPNETCYSFVRRALQKLAGGKRGGSRHRPWFLDTWTSCTKDTPPPLRYDPEGYEDCDYNCEDIQDLPIELRRLEDEHHETPQRRQTFACARQASPQEILLNYKSKSLTDILTVGQRDIVRSRSSIPNLGIPTSIPDTVTKEIGGEGEIDKAVLITTITTSTTTSSNSRKPRLVKQKKSICEETMVDEEEDEYTDMKDLVKALPEFKVSGYGGTRRCGNVFKQSSMNEELMSTERLREKEKVRQNIQKQASFNEELIYRRNRTIDSLRDTFFSTSTAKRFQLLKNGLTSKLKSSTTGIEKVAGTSFKNGFVRILQGWKGEGPPSTRASPIATPSEPIPPCPLTLENNINRRIGSTSSSSGEDKKDPIKPEDRRHSKEDGSDSSKDSSLQSDTSVDSEDSFASVIFVPKPDAPKESTTTNNNIFQTTGVTSPSMTLKNQLSSPKSPQPNSSLSKPNPTSPNVKNFPAPSNLVQQQQCPSLTPTSPLLSMAADTSTIPSTGLTTEEVMEKEPDIFIQETEIKRSERLKQIQDLLRVKTDHIVSKVAALLLELRTDNPSETARIDVAGKRPSVEEHCPSGPFRYREHFHVLNEGHKPLLLTALVRKWSVMAFILYSVSSLSNNTIHGEYVAVNGFNHAVVVERAAGPSTRSPFPLVRRSSTLAVGRLERPFPRLLSLDLFNPETDDMDSDSSGVSSPDSISSVISVFNDDTRIVSKTQGYHGSVLSPEVQVEGLKLLDEASSPDHSLQEHTTLGAKDQPGSSPSLSLLEAAADVASSLEETVDAVIQSSPRSRPKQLQLLDNSALLVLQDSYGSSVWKSERASPVQPTQTTPVLTNSISPNLQTPDIHRFFSSQSSSLSPEKIDSGNTNCCSSKVFPIAMTGYRQNFEFDKDELLEPWDDGCRKHLTEFAEQLSEKLLEEIDQYRQQTSQPKLQAKPTKGLPGLPKGFAHMNDPYLSRLSEEIQDLTKLSEELQERNMYLANLNSLQDSLEIKSTPLFHTNIQNESFNTNSLCSPNNHSNELLTKEMTGEYESGTAPHENVLENTLHESVSGEWVSNEINTTTVTNTTTMTIDSCSRIISPDFLEECLNNKDQGSGDGTVQAFQNQKNEEVSMFVPNLSKSDGITLRLKYSVNSSEARNVSDRTASRNDCSQAESNKNTNFVKMTPSPEFLGNSSIISSDAVKGSGNDFSRDLKHTIHRKTRGDGRSSSEEASLPPQLVFKLDNQKEPPESLTKTESCASSLSGSTSQESLPSDNGGGAITFHRYYHVFREGELDQLIERYVENLHIISSYYDHANWCVVAEKVQVWTI
uniref:Uncharacterized protein n=1 Tax=Timema bartmani TaxID=61472 RepID=A0A7R9EXI2_9NEOP|nr:unnamed protein product [Timema bartmani]